MWSELIVSLDLAASGEILLVGDNVADVTLPVGAGQRFDTGAMVLVTRGEAPAVDATALDTGLANDSLDLVVFRDAVESATNLGQLLAEAYRILKPGAGVMLSEFDAVTLLDSRPQRYPQLLLSNMYPQVGDYLLRRHPRQIDLAMGLVKAGMREGDAYTLDFPLGHFRDYQTYADWVAVEGWRGMDQITAEERSVLLEQLPELMKSVAPAGEFDDVEPVTVARAYKPF